MSTTAEVATLNGVAVNPGGVRHGYGSLGHFTMSEAVRRARHRAAATGIRHRVEVCRTPAGDHFLPVAWRCLHFVVRPVNEPRAGS